MTDLGPSQLPVSIIAPSPAAPDGSASALLRLPFVFTQDSILTSAEFIKEADRRGHRPRPETLSDLHDWGLLAPLYQLTNIADPDRRIEVVPEGGLNSRDWVFEAAAAGQQREIVPDDRTNHGPYTRPAEEADHCWWNGFLYSSWQLLDVRRALSELDWRRHLDAPSTMAEDNHPRTIALCALATRYLPAVLGRYTVPGGLDRDRVWQSRFDIDDRQRLALVSVEPAQLLKWAEELLHHAHSMDPMVKWLPVIRHASADAWDKLHGPVRDAQWMRVAAEVLLRCYEYFAEDGEVPALPDVGQQA